MDIKCVVCGEPWDAYGVNHGDMEKWERELFKKGAGCPSCKGIAPKTPFEPTTLKDLENGDEDPIDRIHACQDYAEGRAPKWERPEPKVLWTCDGCGVQVHEDPAVDTPDGSKYLEYYLPSNAKAKTWYHRPDYDNTEPTLEPAHVFGDNNDSPKVCEFCLQHCSYCNEPISSYIETGDVYDAGASFVDESSGGKESLCVGCFELQCQECLNIGEDCTCNDDDDDEEEIDKDED